MDRALLLAIRTGAFLVLLMPLVVTSQTLFPFIVGKALYSRAIIAIVFGLWVILAYRNPGYRPARSWLLLAFGIYLGVAMLAGIAGVSLQRSLWSTYERMQGIVDLAHWFILTLVLTSVFRSLTDWRPLLNFNLAVSLVMALLGVAQRYGVGLGAISYFNFLQATARVDITLGNPTYIGAYMLVNILIGLGLLSQSFQAPPESETSPALERRRRRRRRARTHPTRFAFDWWQLFWLTTIALDFWVLTLSGTRGAFLGLSAGLGAFGAGCVILRDRRRLLWVGAIALDFWVLTLVGLQSMYIALSVGLVAVGVGYAIWGRTRTARLVVGYSLAAVLGLAGIWAVAALLLVFGTGSTVLATVPSPNVMAGRIVTIALDDPSIQGRLASQAAGLEGFADRPVLGWGPENYIVAWGRYFDEAEKVKERFDQAHNKLVEELTTKGVLGFLSYVALWGLMFRILVGRLRREDSQLRLFILPVGAALTGYFVQNLFLFDTPATVLQFILLLAFVVNLEATFGEAAGNRAGPRPVAPQPGATSAIQAGWASIGRALGGARVFRSNAFLMSGAIVVLALVSLLVYLVSVRPYQAANAVVQTASPALTWEQRLEYFDESIDSFPPLANYPRLILFSQLIRRWGSLSEADARAALAVVEREAQEALKIEPQGWRLYVALSRVYLVASSLDPAYLERANSYLEAAAEMAPDTLEVAALRAQQARAEEEYGSAPEPRKD